MNSDQKVILNNLQSQFDDKFYKRLTDWVLVQSNISDEDKKAIKVILKNILSKTTYMALQNGFLHNINNIESGVMTANAGDSAQFIFIARAILAGFNCSNVDVRSSKYDAIIDYNDNLYRVQIKGISDNIVRFVSRARGGQGIDHTHESNKGKRITSKDCDIYVAVDKQVGICYIIPINDIDDKFKDKKTISTSKLLEYKENWNIINSL